MNIPEYKKYEINTSEVKKMIYCKNCRFLRQPIEEEDRRAPNFFGQELPVLLCAAPTNLKRFSNFMGWELKHELSPAYKNQNNDCSDFETAEQAITQINEELK